MNLPIEFPRVCIKVQMDSQDANIKGVLKNSTAYKYRSKSKDKIPNGKMANAVRSKYKINSKVPRVVRCPSNQCNTNKSTDKISEKLDNSGDNKAGPSRTIHFLSKKDAADRLKPSHIPRRKTIKETPTKENPHIATPKKKVPQHIGERNVQRVQLLINQDYLPEEHPRVEFVARPIPTLGSIYGRMNNIESTNINDWMGEVNAPANSLASNVLSVSCRQPKVAKEMPNNDPVPTQEESVSSALSSCLSPHKHYDIMSSENTSDWIISDIEYPTRDNESGYRTSSPPPPYSTVDVMKSRQHENPDVVIQDSTSRRIDKLIRRATAQMEPSESDSTVTEQPTVVLARVTPTLVLTPHMQKSDTQPARSSSDVDTQVKKCQYPSNSVHADRNQLNQNQHTVPSYVECLSEILQKTTNFEGDGCAGTPNSISSIAGTDLEIRDELSSECTLDDCSMCDHPIEWCHKCGKPSSAKSKKEASSDTTSIANSTICHYNDDSLFEIDASMIKDSIYNIKLYDKCYHHSCSKKHGNQAICDKCKRYRKFPSCRYKDLTTFSSIRGRISLRICRRRLSRVWKKTTERWALWSAKPPQRFKKHRMMRYLQRAAMGEDANVQTNMFIFKETGTDSIARDRKSQAIAALPNFDSSFSSYKSEAGTNSTLSPLFKNKGRNCNLGPSLFPFFYNPERNAIIKQTIEGNPLPEHRKERCQCNDKETQKTENIPTDGSPKQNSGEENSQNKNTKRFEDPESLVQICEITVDDKITGTEDMPLTMQNQMTSTLLHLDAFRMMTMPSCNANTQMWIVCNDAETNVRYPYGVVLDGRSVEMSTTNTENVAFFTPIAVNTEAKVNNSIKVMTSPNIMKTSISNEAQVAPSLTTEKQPGGIGPCTSSQITTNPAEYNQMIFIPVTPMKTVAAATTKKEYFDTGLMVFNSKLNSAVCLETPSLQICHCPIATINLKSCGTDTDEISIEIKSKSATKLKIDVNTDTKSIGNKYTSDIGICTNTILKDSVIETEKEINPTCLSVSTNTFMKQESKFTEQNSSFAFDNVKRFENSTQYSYDDRKDGNCSLRRSEDIGDSYLMSIRTLSRSVEEMEVQTEIAFPDRGFFEVGRNKCNSSEPTSYSLDKPLVDPKLIAYKTAILKDPPKKEQTCQAFSSPKSSSNIRVDTNNKTRQFTSAALSSAMDAVKWIHAGYPVENEQITNDSCNTTVIQKETKSVDITTQYFDQSTEISRTNELNPIPQSTIDYVAVQNNIPMKQDPNDTKSIEGKSDSKIVCSIIKTIEQSEDAADVNAIDESKIETKNIISVQPEENQATVQMVDGVTSDVLVKDVKEITLQARPESCDAATECYREKERKSACALTSRCILPGLPYNCCENHKYGDLSGDCRFVYGLPHCVVHTQKPDDVRRQTERCLTTMRTEKQCVQAAGLVITLGAPAPHNQTIGQKADNNKDFNQSPFQCVHSQGVSLEENSAKSEIVTKCSCPSKPSTFHNPPSKTIDDLPMITLNTRTCTSNYSRSKKTNNLPAMTIADSSASQPKQQTRQPSRKVSVVLPKPLTNVQHPPQSVAIMTSTKSATEQQTSNVTNQAAHVSDTTSINNERFGRTVGLITSCHKYPTTHRQTSHSIVDNLSHTTSINGEHSKRSVGFTTSNRQKPVVYQRHTSNIYNVASVKTSVKQQMNRSIGLITSRQSNPPIHHKACSNIIKCTSAKTSMYDELNTQSIGVINSNAQNYYVPETRLEEHCVQSLGLINAAWKGKAAVKTRSPHRFVDAQNSEFGFLLSPKEYEALYKTTRYLSKEAARATSAIREENLCYQQNYNQTDASVEVMLRAEMRSAQNMTSPVMHSATVMTAPSDASSEFEYSTGPTTSCSEKYSLEIPTRDNDNADSSVKNHLAASCRYYSSLLTKHLDNVKENITKHLASAPESPMDLPIYCEACTMKPSAREEFGCQTFKDRPKEKPNILDPAENETDICGHDKEHLQSVYYMLTAIEGRLRRLKSNVEYNS